MGNFSPCLLYFAREDINNGFRAVDWCVSHGMIQQAITMLQENMARSSSSIQIKFEKCYDKIKKILSWDSL